MGRGGRDEAEDARGRQDGSLSQRNHLFCTAGMLPCASKCRRDAHLCRRLWLALPCPLARRQMCHASRGCGLAFAVYLSVLFSAESSPSQPALELRGWTKLEEKKVLLLERFFFPFFFSPPPISIHLPREVETAADIGAGSISYVNVRVCKSRPLTPGVVPASILVSPAGSGRRAWRASLCPPGWNGAGRPCRIPSLHAGDKGCCSGTDPAPTTAAPVGLGSPSLSTQSPSRVSRVSGCHSPEVTRALDLGQETHLVTNLLLG